MKPVSLRYADPTRDDGTFLPGGWLVSGDLGKLDKEGRLFITGRKKDLIIRGAHNIDPQMIEDTLLAHPEVSTAAAVGMPDAYSGELPVAFVALQDGANLDEAALIAFLRERIDDPVAVPKRIGILEALPVTPVGKIFKPTLRREAIRWAVESAAEKMAGALSEISIDVSENLTAHIKGPESLLTELRDDLAGMPVSIQFEVESNL